MLLNALDILYMVCCDFYRRREPDDFKYSGIILLTVVILLNLFFIGLLWDDFINKSFIPLLEEKSSRWLLIIGSYIFCGVCLLIRYVKITSYAEIKEYFNTYSINKRRLHYVISVIYILISIVSTLGYVFWGALN